MLTDVSRCEASRNFHFVSMDLRESGKQGSRLVVDSRPEIRGLTRLRFCVLLQDRSAGAWERAIGRALLVFGIVSVPIVTYMMYAGDWPAIRKLNYNFGLASSVALILFCAVRCDTIFSRFRNTRLIVALGEASYSIYVTHFLIFVLAASYIGGALPATAANGAFVAAKYLFHLGLILLISLGLHAYVEVPARQWLRGLWREAAPGRRCAVAYSVFANPALAAVLFVLITPADSTASALSDVGTKLAEAAAPGSALALSAKDAAISKAQALPAAAAPKASQPKQQTVAVDSQPDGTIHVLSATYGGNCGAPPGNATGDAQMACDGEQKCTYTVDVNRLGDPAHACGKAFALEYRCTSDGPVVKAAIPAEAGLGGKSVELFCQSGAPSERPAAEWTGIRILSATYGKNCGARIGNVTEAVEKACGAEKSCDYTVDVNKLGDPVQGCDKSFFVKYQCGGGTSTRLAGLPSQPGYGRVIHLACP